MSVDGMKLLGRVVGSPCGRSTEREPSASHLGEPLSGVNGAAVLVEEHMAEHFGLAIGDQIEIYDGTAWMTVDVAGVVSSPEYIWPARNRQDTPHLAGQLRRGVCPGAPRRCRHERRIAQRSW